MEKLARPLEAVRLSLGCRFHFGGQDSVPLAGKQLNLSWVCPMPQNRPSVCAWQGGCVKQLAP